MPTENRLYGLWKRFRVSMRWSDGVRWALTRRHKNGQFIIMYFTGRGAIYLENIEGFTAWNKFLGGWRLDDGQRVLNWNFMALEAVCMQIIIMRRKCTSIYLKV